MSTEHNEFIDNIIQTWTYLLIHLTKIAPNTGKHLQKTAFFLSISVLFSNATSKIKMKRSCFWEMYQNKWIYDKTTWSQKSTEFIPHCQIFADI